MKLEPLGDNIIMKRIKNIKNYKVNIEVKRSDSTTGESYEKENKEF